KRDNSSIDELCFNGFKHCFSDGVVIRTSFFHLKTVQCQKLQVPHQLVGPKISAAYLKYYFLLLAFGFFSKFQKLFLFRCTIIFSSNDPDALCWGTKF